MSISWVACILGLVLVINIYPAFYEFLSAGLNFNFYIPMLFRVVGAVVGLLIISIAGPYALFKIPATEYHSSAMNADDEEQYG